MKLYHTIRNYILEMKKVVTPQGYNMAKNSFLSEVTFKPSLN